MKLIEFKYHPTAKSKFFLDATCFQALHAHYFRKLDQLRSTNSILYYHEETWLNKNAKTVIWFDAQQHGRLRVTEGKGMQNLFDKYTLAFLVMYKYFH